MKTNFVFVLVIALGVAAIDSAPQKRDVSSVSSSTTTLNFAEALEDVLTAYKHIMPCGDTATGMIAVAPLRIPAVTLDINQELLILNGSIQNLVISGLNDFIIINLATNATNNRTTFDFLLKDVQVLGSYSLYINADLAGYKFIQNLNGLMNTQYMDVRYTGGMTLGVNAAGGILVSDMSVTFQIGDVISHILDTQWMVALNNYVNKSIRENALLWIELNREFLNTFLSNYTTTYLNEELANITLSQYIQDMVNVSAEWNAVSCSA